MSTLFLLVVLFSIASAVDAAASMAPEATGGLKCLGNTTTSDALCLACQASATADKQACKLCMDEFPVNRLKQVACLECVVLKMVPKSSQNQCAKCAKQFTSAKACFNCLYQGLKPENCHVDPTMPPRTSFLKIMLTRSIGTVWSQKGTLAVETALWKFLQAHSASCGRGAVNSYAYGKTLTTTVMLASKSQVAKLVKKLKETTPKKASDLIVKAAGENLPCGTSITFFYNGNASLVLKCGSINKLQAGFVLSVPGLCCQDANQNNSSRRALAQSSASACGVQGYPVSGMCPYPSGSIVWCTATSLPYMIVNGSAQAYSSYPLEADPSNPAKTWVSTAVSSYNLVGTPEPTFTTSVCCTNNINGCNVVAVPAPTFPQPAPYAASGWVQGASFFNNNLPTPVAMISPAYLLSSNGAYALHLSSWGDLAVYAVTSNGALDTKTVGRSWKADTLGIWEARNVATLKNIGSSKDRRANGIDGYYGNYNDYSTDMGFDSSYNVTCVQGTLITTITNILAGDLVRSPTGSIISDDFGSKRAWDTSKSYKNEEYTCQQWAAAGSYSLAMKTDCNLVIEMNAATVNGQVVASRTLTTITNTINMWCDSTCSEGSKQVLSDSVYGTPTTTTTPYPITIWATNTSNYGENFCNLHLSNSGQLTINDTTYAKTLWSSPILNPEQVVNQIYATTNGWVPDSPITCPTGTLISNIDSAAFGNFGVCASTMTEASAVLRDQCIGRQECFPDFNKGLNGYDPCPNYVKWMDARWDCEVPVVPVPYQERTVNQVYAKKNGWIPDDPITCPVGTLITNIDSAAFGNFGSCPSTMKEASGVLRDQCIGRQECFPDFNKGFNGYDPCPFYVKWMDAKWDCGTLSDTYKGSYTSYTGPSQATRYSCYRWTSENSSFIASQGNSLEAQRQTCSSVGAVFTQGSNAEFPGCGGCWCCMASPGLLTAGHIVAGPDAVYAMIHNPKTMVVEAIPFTSSGYELAGFPSVSFFLPSALITPSTVAGMPIASRPQFNGLNAGQYLGQIQIFGYGTYEGNLGFCLQMQTGSSTIMVNSNSMLGYLQCTPNIGSSGNFFTAYPLGSSSAGEMVFWMQPTQNSFFSCVGISGNTIQLLNSCDPQSEPSQQFFMTAITPDAPIDTSGTSMPMTWLSISSPSLPGQCLSQSAGSLSFAPCNPNDTTQWFSTLTANEIRMQFNTTAGILQTIPFTDPAILQKLAGAWKLATADSTIFQAIGTYTFPTSMNSQSGTASVTFNSGVINPPLTSLVQIEHFRNVWLGTMQSQIEGSAVGVQSLPLTTYISAYPRFVYASGGGSFLDVTLTFTVDPPPPPPAECPAERSPWWKITKGVVVAVAGVGLIATGNVWTGLYYVASGTGTVVSATASSGSSGC